MPAKSGLSLKPVLYRVEYALYFLVTRAVLALPHHQARRIGRLIGRLSGLMLRDRRRLVLSNLALAMPQLDTPERRRVARACFEHYGATFLDALSAARFEPQEIEDRFEVEGWEYLDAAAATGRGLFILSGHYGAWDMGAFPLSQRLGELHLLARVQKNPFVSREVEAFRRRWGNVLLSRKGAGPKMLGVIRKGGRIAVMIDQRVHSNNGFLIPFLGRPAWTTPVLARLSIFKGVPVIPVFCVPLEEGRYRVTIHPAIEPEGRGEDAEVTLTRRYLEVIEEEILRRPEMWMWMHRRWQLTHRSRTRFYRDRLSKNSALPADRTFTSFELRRLPRSLRRQTRRLRRRWEAFLEASRNALVFGAPGTGKTHLACALGHDLLALGYGVRFAPARELIGDLLAAAGDDRLGRALRRLDVFDLLILDAVEEVRTGKESAMLLTLLGTRSERRSTLVTSRLHFREWSQILGDDGASTIGDLAASAIELELSRPDDPVRRCYNPAGERI